MVLDVMKQHIRTGLDESYVLRCFTDICQAVAAMHSCDPPIIHRDLKVGMGGFDVHGQFWI